MPQRLTWTDAAEIAERLYALAPEEDPLQVRFTDLLRRVTALPGFADQPEAATESRLEAIQLAWLELTREDAGGR